MGEHARSGSAARPEHRAQRQPERGIPHLSTVGLLLVAITAGLLFATNASLFRREDVSRPQDLAGLIQDQNVRVANLELEVESLRAARDRALEGAHGQVVAPSSEIKIASASTALEGRGLRVQMWDGPAALPADSQQDVNELVVHQQDLEGVVNALWAGGAEAVAIQGHRLQLTSAVRCVGNVLLINGRQYSPPYVIEAIGDPARMRQSLEESPAVIAYLEAVETLGLGWQLSTLSQLRLPPASEPGAFTHAREL